METRLRLLDSSLDSGNIGQNTSINSTTNVKNDINNNKEIDTKDELQSNSSKSGFFDNTLNKKTYLRRLHIGTNRSQFSQKVLEYLGKLKNQNKYLTEGFKLGIEGAIAIIIKCDPVGGYLSEDTIIYIEDSIKPLERIYFLWDVKDYNFLKDCISLFVENSKVITRDLISSRVYYGPFKITKINDNSLLSKNCSLKLILKDKKDSTFVPNDNNDDSFTFEDGDNSGRFTETTYVSDKACETMSDTEDSEECDYYLFHQDNSGNLILTDPNDKIYDFFHKMFRMYLKNLLEIPRFFFFGNNQLIGDLTFFVSSLEPPNKPGYIDHNTEIYFGFDPFENFDQVTVCPLKDTLPINYRYNLLEDCVKPFFRLNSFKIFRLGDVFNFSGIQFRITNLSKRNPNDDNYFNFSKYLTCPKYGRINSNTEINIGKPVKPKLMDLLPFERIEILRRSAPCYRENLLICFAADLDVNSLDRIYQTNSSGSTPINSLSNSLNNSLNHSTNSSINTSTGNSLNNSLNSSYNSSTSMKHSRDDSKHKEDLNESNNNIDTFVLNNMCTVCCDTIDTKRNGNLIFLTCGHVFHKRCVSTWISTKKSCPNCRTKLAIDKDIFISSSSSSKYDPSCFTNLSSNTLIKSSESILNSLNGFSLIPISTSTSNSISSNIPNISNPTSYNSPSSLQSNYLVNQQINTINNSINPLYNMSIIEYRNLNQTNYYKNTNENDIFYQYDTFERDTGRQRNINHPSNILDNSMNHFDLDDLHIENIIDEEFTEEESESDLELYFNRLST